jgi:hypothetical protein
MRDFFGNCSNRDDSSYTWRLIVNEFADRKLTVETDKLPALSGVARRFQEHTGDRYLAGLWLKTLVHDLAWTRPFLEPLVERSAVTLAPFWSWTAVNGADYKNTGLTADKDAAFEVIDAQVPLAGANEFGEVKSAELVMLAAVIRMDACYYGRTKFNLTARWSKVAAYQPDYKPEEVFTGEVDVLLLSGPTQRTILQADPEVREEPFRWPRCQRWHGLAVRAVTTGADIYERLGYVDSLTASSWDSETLTSVLDAWRPYARRRITLV